MIARVLQNGWRQAAAQWRMAILLYVVNLSAALIPALAFRSSASPLGIYPDVQKMLSAFRFSTFIDALHFYGKEIAGVVPMLPWLVAIVVVINTFLAGGVVSSLCGMEMDFSGKRFFSTSAEYFFRFFRLLLLWGVFAVIILGLALAIAGAAIGWTTEHAQTEAAGMWVAVAAGGFLLVLIAWIIAVADYTRIIIVANDERRVFHALKEGLQFILWNFFRAFLIFFLPFLILVTVIAAYFIKAEWLGMTSVGTIGLAFIAQQMVTLVRHWLHIFVYASETTLYMDQVPTVL